MRITEHGHTAVSLDLYCPKPPFAPSVLCATATCVLLLLQVLFNKLCIIFLNGANSDKIIEGKLTLVCIFFSNLLFKYSACFCFWM